MMPTLRTICFVLTLICCYSAVAQPIQRVGTSLQLQYAAELRSNPNRARLIKQGMDSAAAAQITSFEVFDAPASGLIKGIAIIKTTYSPGAAINVDGSASGMLSNLANLKGVSNPTQSVRKLKISGVDSRRISFEANRGDGKMGSEALAMLDPVTNTLWAVQIVFAKQNSILPMVGTDLEKERTAADAILSSVSLLPGR
jgi:hypothetical protein